MATVSTTLVKTLGTTLNALQTIASGGVVIGSEVSVLTNMAAGIYLHFGRTTTSAPTIGVTFLIEACSVPTGTLAANTESQWYPIASYTTGIIACSNQTPSATSGAALTVGAVTGFTAQELCVVSANSAAPTLSNTEWYRVKTAASTTITAYGNFKNAYTTGGTWDQAEMAMMPVDLSGVGRIRCTIDGSGHNQAFLSEVYMVTTDSASST